MENYGKTKDKKMVCEIKIKVESRLRVGKVLAPYNARSKMTHLIKLAKQVWFVRMFVFPKKKK